MRALQRGLIQPYLILVCSFLILTDHILQVRPHAGHRNTDIKHTVSALWELWTREAVSLELSGHKLTNCSEGGAVRRRLVYKVKGSPGPQEEGQPWTTRLEQ